MANGVFIAEQMASTKLGSKLRSAQQATEIKNGAVVTLGAEIAGKVGVYASAPVAAVSDKVFIVDGVALDPSEERTLGIDDYINPANMAYRVRIPVVDDVFSISANMVTPLAANLVVGNIIETPASGNLWKESVTPTLNVSFVAEIKELWTFGTRAIPMVRVEVKKVV